MRDPSPEELGADLDEVDELLMRCLDSGSSVAEFEHEYEVRTELADELRRRYRLLRKYGFIGAEPPSTPTPETIGNYKILRRIGIGGMGVVHLAEQEPVGRRVALKLLRPERLGSASARERFQRECTTLGSLDHPGICPVYDVGEVDGQPYLAMRYLDGESLAAHLERLRVAAPASRTSGAGSTKSAERARVERVVRWFEKLARAVHAAHSVGLVHRDLKPANIMITKDEPVILDFGLVQDEQTDSGLTLSEDIVGTPAYLPPERIDGAQADVRSDVYSLGVTLYEALTLQRPFEAPNRDALYRQIVSGDHVPAHALNLCVRRDLSVVTATAMERDPGCRYATALDFAEDLRRVRCLEPIQARPAPALLRLRRWTQRNPALAVLVAALAVGLVISLYLLQRIREEARIQRTILASFNPLLELGNANPNDVDRLQTALGPGASYAEVIRAWSRMLEGQVFGSDGAEAAIRLRVGQSLSYGGDWLKARENLERAAELFLALDDQESAAVAETHAAWCLTMLGRPCEGRRRADAASRVLRRLRDALDPDYVWARLCVVHSYQPHLGEQVLAANVREVEEIRRQLRAEPGAEFPVFSADLAAATVVDAIDPKRAEALLREALAGCERMANDNNLMHALIRWQWVHVALALDGEPTRAKRFYRESVAAMKRVGGPVENDWIVLLSEPLSWMPLEDDELEEALAVMQERARLTRVRFGIANPRAIQAATELSRFLHRHPEVAPRGAAAAALRDLAELGRRLAAMRPRAADAQLRMLDLAEHLRDRGDTGLAREITGTVATGPEPENIDQRAARGRAVELLAELGK